MHRLGCLEKTLGFERNLVRTNLVGLLVVCIVHQDDPKPWDLFGRVEATQALLGYTRGILDTFPHILRKRLIFRGLGSFTYRKKDSKKSNQIGSNQILRKHLKVSGRRFRRPWRNNATGCSCLNSRINALTAACVLSLMGPRHIGQNKIIESPLPSAVHIIGKTDP